MNIILLFFIIYWPHIIGIISTIMFLIFLYKKNDNTKIQILESIALGKIFEDTKIEYQSLLKSDSNEDLSENFSYLNDIADIIGSKIIDDNEKKYSLWDIYLDYDEKKLSFIHKFMFGWILFWIGILAFLITRLCFFYYFTGDGLVLGYIIYYIILGLIIFFRN